MVSWAGDTGGRRVGDPEPHPHQPFPSVTSTSTPESRPGASPFSPSEGHVWRQSTWALAWLRGPWKAPQPLTESRATLSASLECPCPCPAPENSYGSPRPRGLGWPESAATECQPLPHLRGCEIHATGPTVTPAEPPLPPHCSQCISASWKTESCLLPEPRRVPVGLRCPPPTASGTDNEACSRSRASRAVLHSAGTYRTPTVRLTHHVCPPSGGGRGQDREVSK